MRGLFCYWRLIMKACKAAGPDHLTDNPGNTYKVTTTAKSSGKYPCF